MEKRRAFPGRLAVAAALAVTALAASAAERSPRVAFTVSAADPAAHLFHVVMRCDGLPGDRAEFRMPVWTPGYYGLFDFAGNVRAFTALDGRGQPLAWEKTGASSWTVQKGSASLVELRYDVLARQPFVANAYLDEARGYVLPGALFLYPPGGLRQPVTVKVTLPAGWSDVATGLDPAPSGEPHRFVAPDFDVLYDSPILMGNLESLPPFYVRGVRHDFIGHDLGDFDRRAFVEDLKAVVQAGVDIIGEVPYSHYVFLGIGPGRGGIEHLNSAAVSFGGKGEADRAARQRELSFLAHEYFHNFNVKRIRPVALGPFDYDRPNETNMLWVSEGFTVYYEYLMLARSGRMSQDEVLAALSRDIAAFENSPGRLFQSATGSSRETWRQGPFGRQEGRVRRTISYYEKGAVLGMLLDFRIRHETRNRRSLDTVMRELYRKYYKGLRRGWTDGEFREACERVAGARLDENFEYASTTREIDYATYLAYAGLELEPPVELPEAFAGAIVEDRGDALAVAAVEPHSPAAAVLAADDVIAEIDGARVDASGFDALLANAHPGDVIRLRVERKGAGLEVALPLAHRAQRTFRIRPMAKPSSRQAAILGAWTAPTVR
ncbi:MAG: family metallopeptidase [Acidobacteria bacterium]|nr:family metallopeptidase [Acidobacteriota bacterium]